MKTDELPAIRSQPNPRKIRSKVGIRATFFCPLRSKIFFFVGWDFDFILETDYKEPNPAKILRKHPINSLLSLISCLYGTDQILVPQVLSLRSHQRRPQRGRPGDERQARLGDVRRQRPAVPQGDLRRAQRGGGQRLPVPGLLQHLQRGGPQSGPVSYYC